MSQDSQPGRQYYRRKLARYDVNNFEHVEAPYQSTQVFPGDSRKI
jgi:hypothetical protein